MSRDDIESARRLLAGVARITPLEPSGALSDLVGARVTLKGEHRQRTGSFKLRGAYCHIARHLAQPGAVDERAGVVAASAGNHAQGVALAASLLGTRSTVFMPAAAPLPKVAATRNYGAEVHLVAGGLTEAFSAADEFASRSGAHLVPPFDDRDVIAGQGTVGLEVADQLGHSATVVVPVGGGGLIAGMAVALRAAGPGWRLVGVEAEAVASMAAALSVGRPVAVPHCETMADGIAVGQVSELTLAHARTLLDEVVTVSEEELSAALLLLLEREKAVVEPAGAASVAALLAGKVKPGPGGELCAVLSGGNVDPTLLMRVVRHGLSAAGRYLSLRLALTDSPGALHGLLGVVASLGLNVVEVEHHRVGIRLPVGQVDVRLTVETRDPAHRDGTLAALRECGYPVEIA